MILTPKQRLTQLSEAFDDLEAQTPFQHQEVRGVQREIRNLLKLCGGSNEPIVLVWLDLHTERLNRIIDENEFKTLSQ